MEVVELLLENGAQLDLEDAHGKTPLSRAKDHDIIHLLAHYPKRLRYGFLTGTPENRIINNFDFVAFWFGWLSYVSLFLT
jgi:hypothetical protein